MIATAGILLAPWIQSITENRFSMVSILSIRFVVNSSLLVEPPVRLYLLEWVWTLQAKDAEAASTLVSVHKKPSYPILRNRHLSKTLSQPRLHPLSVPFVSQRHKSWASPAQKVMYLDDFLDVQDRRFVKLRRDVCLLCYFTWKIWTRSWQQTSWAYMIETKSRF